MSRRDTGAGRSRADVRVAKATEERKREKERESKKREGRSERQRSRVREEARTTENITSPGTGAQRSSESVVVRRVLTFRGAASAGFHTMGRRAVRSAHDAKRGA